MEFDYNKAMYGKQPVLYSSILLDHLNSVKRNGRCTYRVSTDLRYYLLEANTKEKEEACSTTCCSLRKMDTSRNTSI